MTSHPYLGPGNFIIDICDPCRLVWLDKGELTAIALAPGRDRNI
jgi:Zn-finger nucleic acid-binding protein